MKLNWYKYRGSISTEEHNVWHKTGSFGDDAVNENSTPGWVPAQIENSNILLSITYMQSHQQQEKAGCSWALRNLVGKRSSG